jgi:hypothetical protein
MFISANVGGDGNLMFGWKQKFVSDKNCRNEKQEFPYVPASYFSFSNSKWKLKNSQNAVNLWWFLFQIFISFWLCFSFLWLNYESFEEKSIFIHWKNSFACWMASIFFCANKVILIYLFLYKHAHIFTHKFIHSYMRTYFMSLLLLLFSLPLSLCSSFNEYWCFKAARKVLTCSLTCDILLCRNVA